MTAPPWRSCPRHWAPGSGNFNPLNRGKGGRRLSCPPRESQKTWTYWGLSRPVCVSFHFWNPSSWPQDVSPNKKIYNSADWCNQTIEKPFDTSASFHSRKLPQGVFFLCGNWAWAGIPSCLWGGPCTLGRLTTFTPNTMLLHDWKHKQELAHKRR